MHNAAGEPIQAVHNAAGTFTTCQRARYKAAGVSHSKQPGLAVHLAPSTTKGEQVGGWAVEGEMTEATFETATDAMISSH
jgi:hypothetical protein